MILDIQKDYLILFNEENKQFIKANGYDHENKKVFWDGGEYYNSFEDLVENLGLKKCILGALLPGKFNIIRKLENGFSCYT